MKNLISSLSLFLFLTVILYSCTDDYFEFDKITFEDWRPELAVPLVNTSLTLEDIVIKKDSAGQIQTNGDGILEVIYESSVINTIGQRAYKVPRQLFRDTFQTPQPIPPFNTGQTIPFQSSIDLDFKDTTGFGVVVDSILLKQGRLVFTIENEYQHKVNVSAKFRTFKDANGDTLVINYSIPAAMPPSRPVTVGTKSVDLTGYELNMTEDKNGMPANNKIPIDLNFTIELTPGVGSTPEQEVRVVGALQNVDFKEFYGYLGNTVQEIEKDTFAVQLFRNFTTSEFFLSNPFLNVTVFNSFSVPIEFTFLELDALNSRKMPSVIPFKIPPSLQPLVLKYPKKYGRDTTNVQLDSSNSNLVDVVSFLLEKVAYDSKVQFNPGGLPASGEPRNFITDTSDIGLDVEFRIPFEGRAAGFFIEDTIDFNFELADELDSGLVRIIAENAFPIEIAFQVTFLDSAMEKVDSLFQSSIGSGNNSIVAPATDDGIAARKITDLTISGERLKQLTRGRFAAIKARLNTTDAEQKKNIVFRPEYRLGLNIGMKAKILID